MKTETNNLRLQYAQPESYEIKVRARKTICGSFETDSIKEGNTNWWEDDDE